MIHRPKIMSDAFSRNMSDTPEKCIGCGIMRTKDTLVKHMCPDCFKKDSQEREEFIKKKDWMV